VPVLAEIRTRRLVVVDASNQDRIVARIDADGAAVFEVLLPPGPNGRSGIVVSADPTSHDGVAVTIQLYGDGALIDSIVAWRDAAEPWCWVGWD
jgi:hypothetical protein